MRTIFGADKRLLTRQIFIPGLVGAAPLLSLTTSANPVLLDSPTRNTTVWSVTNSSAATIFFLIVHPDDSPAVPANYQSFFQLSAGESFTLDSMDGSAQIPARSRIYVHANGAAIADTTKGVKLFSY